MKGKISTILIGILLAICIVVTVLVFPLNNIDTDQVSGDAATEIVAKPTVAILQSIMLLLILLITSAIMIASIICIVVSVKNFHSDIKYIRVANKIYCPVAVCLTLASVIKIIIMISVLF